jgi:hypothetical protein
MESFAVHERFGDAAKSEYELIESPATREKAVNITMKYGQ